jgi:hypothetical protein
MAQTFAATFKNGAFVPDEECDLPENTRVQVVIPRTNLIPPKVTDPEERRKILQEVVELMKSNPIPESAPRKFTREELHERR